MKTLASIQIKQSGAALPVALVMLLISTITGLASIRSATNQTKMSTNIYERSLAYQAAEVAMRKAEEAISDIYPKECGGKLTPDSITNSQSIGHDCTDTDNAKICPSIPLSTFTGTGEGSSNWESISELNSSAFLSFNNTPQYYIERIGKTDAKTLYPGDTDSAYHQIYTQPTSIVYRVTARSGNPADPKQKSHSIVALQTIIIRACDTL